jgi:hypothetical protein
MDQANAVKASERIFYLDAVADFEHKLSYRPRTLLTGRDQTVEDARLDNTWLAQDIGRVQRRIVLHGKLRLSVPRPRGSYCCRRGQLMK